MKICLLNGNPDGDNREFEDGLSALVNEWTGKSHQVTRFDLRDLKIVSCTGCWTCWLKTPGLCSAKDDTHEIRGAFIASDLAVFATPLVRGFPSALMKDVIDKLIPHLLPSIVITDGEYMHLGRYEKFPAYACLLQEEKDTEPEDLKLVTDYFKRCATHFRSPFIFSRMITDPVAEVRDEIDRL